ncbi:MAG: pectic acid lyase [Fuerstiella sp.]|nr:pectic acid lyase [Fuerstiella sp.]
MNFHRTACPDPRSEFAWNSAKHPYPRPICSCIVIALLMLAAVEQTWAQSLTQTEARATLKKVVKYYRTHIGYEGAYLWRYSADLTAQEGEGTATRSSGWTQPPGTTTVGEAYLHAWRVSGESHCLDAATEAARALVRSQLMSGGWSSHFDLGDQGRKRYAYRTDGEQRGKNNLSTFDDNKSQSALMLLMHVDEALEFRDQAIHDAVSYALEHMLKSQYPNGAWPQQYSEPPKASQYPVLAASYPESWPRTYPKTKYIGHYTLNDSNMSHIVDMMFEAHQIYKREDCFQSAVKTGDFFLAAQMPDPQPGWAQQYDLHMNPVWARKFEPAAITGGESQSVMKSLLTLFRFTGDRRFVAPLPKALAYYRRSLLPDGRLARFYELKTNRPLYFTKKYELTYSDSDMPTHYGFKVSSKLDRLEQDYQKVLIQDAADAKPERPQPAPVKLSSSLQRRATAVTQALDVRGAWVETGHMRHQKDSLDVIEMRTFVTNLGILAEFAGAQ